MENCTADEGAGMLESLKIPQTCSVLVPCANVCGCESRAMGKMKKTVCSAMLFPG